MDKLDILGYLSSFGIAGIILLLVVATIYKAVIIVPQASIYVIERFGKYRTSLSAGLHLIVPFIDTIRTKVSTQERIIDVKKQQVITKDNVNIYINGVVYAKVIDAMSVTYNVDDYEKAIAVLTTTTLRSTVGSMSLDDTLSSRDSINQELAKALDVAVGNWGVKVVRVEVSEIEVSQTISDTMNLQMIAERERRAIETKANAEKEATIRKAEALRQEQFLQAEAIERMAQAKRVEQVEIATGQSEAMRLINEALASNPKAAEFLLAKERITAFNELAKNPNSSKVVVPYETSELIGSLSILKDFIKGEQ